MFSETGPVTTRPSAWRGEATKATPKRDMSNCTLPEAFSSASQPLQPAADTCRSRSDRPKSLRAFSSTARASSGAAPFTTQLLPRTPRDPVVAGEADGARARLLAQAAERAAPEVDGHGRAARVADRVGGAGRGAGATAVACARVDDGEAAEALREARGPLGVGDGLPAEAGAELEDAGDAVHQRSCPQ